MRTPILMSSGPHRETFFKSIANTLLPPEHSPHLPSAFRTERLQQLVPRTSPGHRNTPNCSKILILVLGKRHQQTHPSRCHQTARQQHFTQLLRSSADQQSHWHSNLEPQVQKRPSSQTPPSQTAFAFQRQSTYRRAKSRLLLLFRLFCPLRRNHTPRLQRNNTVSAS